MKRFACVAAVCLASTLGPRAASAQVQATSTPSDPTLSVELNFGPTLGHKSGTFVGGEASLRLSDDLDVVIEASHMGNVGTTDLDDRAAIIADFLGGTAATAFKVNHGAAGLRYNFTLSPMVHPYVLGAVGIAQVKTAVEFSVNGTAVDPATGTSSLVPICRARPTSRSSCSGSACTCRSRHGSSGISDIATVTSFPRPTT